MSLIALITVSLGRVDAVVLIIRVMFLGIVVIGIEGLSVYRLCVSFGPSGRVCAWEGGGCCWLLKF